MTKFEAGFIGAGNMGSALARAAIRSVGGERVALCRSTAAGSARTAEALGCAARTAEEILAHSRYVFLGFKPQAAEGVLRGLTDAVSRSGAVFVSMLAGVDLARLEGLLGPEKKIIRIMPNTPCAVGSGLILLCANGNVTAEELAGFRALMAPAGELDELREPLMDAASALSGCGPAFACLFLEGLADGAVACGLPREKAARYAAQMLLGTARLALEPGSSPAALKDAVCSPGGSTIEGVRALERAAFRGACMDAVDAAYRKTKKLG